MSKKTKGFPYDHVVNEETKTIEINWNSRGAISRYGVPVLVKRFYPGYSFVFTS